MPITVVSTQRKFLSDVVKGVNTFDNANAMQFNFGGIKLTNLDGSAAPITVTSDVEPIGLAVVFDAADGWTLLNNVSVANVGSTTSDLPNGASVAVIVGNKFGAGFNPEDVTLVAAPSADNTVGLFRGANNTGIVKNADDTTPATYTSIDWTFGGNLTIDTNAVVTEVSAATIQAFYDQLEVQGIMVIDNAEVITPSFTD